MSRPPYECTHGLTVSPAIACDQPPTPVPLPGALPLLLLGLAVMRFARRGGRRG